MVMTQEDIGEWGISRQRILFLQIVTHGFEIGEARQSTEYMPETEKRRLLDRRRGVRVYCVGDANPLQMQSVCRRL